MRRACGPSLRGARDRRRPRARGSSRSRERSHRTGPAPPPRGLRSCASASGLSAHVAVEKIGIERCEVEAPARLVDELHAVRPRLFVELLFYPRYCLLDWRFALSHGVPASLLRGPEPAAAPGRRCAGTCRTSSPAAACVPAAGPG